MAVELEDERHFDTTDLEPALNAVITESKAGYKTTEFWVSVIVAVLTVVDGIPLPEKYEAVVVGAIAVAYALSRGFAKAGIPSVEPTKAE